VRRIAKRAVLGLLSLIGLSAALVLALRFIAPPASMVMLLEPGSFDEIDYHWVDRSAISIAGAQAAIAAEDQKFLDHHGLDYTALGDAIGAYRRGGDLRGASTITQQVAKNLFLWNGRSFFRKGLEAYFALLIELMWPKERILEIYLNIAEFGPNVFGIESAAINLLDARANSLTIYQAALLAAVLPSPKRMNVARPSEYVRGRQAEIVEQMRLLESRGHYRGMRW
jgi:monofunctional biosynthetic peptidoglycan transglycosylase